MPDIVTPFSIVLAYDPVLGKFCQLLALPLVVSCSIIEVLEPEVVASLAFQVVLKFLDFAFDLLR